MMFSTVKQLLIAACVAIPGFARGDFPTSQPYAGVTYLHERRNAPAQEFYVVQIDLTNPKVSVRVAPAGPDPDGDGEWQTVLMPPSKIADREGLDLCVNASFFSAKSTADAEGAKSGFVAGKWSKAVGFAMTDGVLWSSVLQPKRPTFWIDRAGGAHLSNLTELPKSAEQAVQGNAFVLKDGEPVEPAGMMKVQHPRTVVGLDKAGHTLTLLTIDGRKPGVAVGMTGLELASEMKRLGCIDAINLDGGGSTELLMRNPESGKSQVINHPSDGRERAVADVVGVIVKK